MRSGASAAGFAAIERFMLEFLSSAPDVRQVPAARHSLDLIGHAAERRGLIATAVGAATYFHQGSLAVGGVRRPMQTTLVGRHARTLCDSKHLTTQMLAAAGLPAPRGFALEPHQVDEALATVGRGGRWVVKPSCGSKGHGVSLCIETEDELRAAWAAAGRAARQSSPRFMLEEFVDGLDLRVFVVGTRAVGATTRLPAHVVGNGRDTIVELIEAKTLQRAGNAYLAPIPLSVDPAILARAGRTTDDVPDADELVLLNGTANIAGGGEGVDLTDLLHPGLLDLAVAATRAVPGLGLAGVDLLSPDIESPDGAVVLEVNASPDVAGHHYVAHGLPRDVAGAIVDEMISTARPPRAGRRRARLRTGIRSAAPERLPTGEDGPVERFVRDVLPVVPGGPQKVSSATRHVQLVTRAARRRGLTIRTVGHTRFFHDQTLAIGGVHRHRITTLATGMAIDLCDAKDLTKQMLRVAGLPVPPGKVLRNTDLDEACAQLRVMGRAVLKPAYGMRGLGVIGGIVTESDLRAAWATTLETMPKKDSSLLLEQQMEGLDVRVFVVGDRAVAATVRLPSYVVGDGRQSIAELIDEKQRQRAENAKLAGWPLIVNAALLAQAGRALADVPAAGTVAVLHDIANLHTGGENVDVTDLVHPGLLDMAVAAVRALPGLRVAGVDLMIPAIDVVDGAVVLEVNAGANIEMHHHPAHGKPRKVAKAIVEEMIASSSRRATPSVSVKALVSATMSRWPSRRRRPRGCH